ncbi:hypothetical protein OUZ56_005389 [Daphnia magna]|uniref:Uncharacterized protein n=1 Tax=Daphnia magna TaxID=35525 RepID=A0ABQ9YTE4_9CRUS|nr:hypothetical protein OUZ56_005389 [Daphnia magna]
MQTQEKNADLPHLRQMDVVEETGGLIREPIITICELSDYAQGLDEKDKRHLRTANYNKMYPTWPLPGIHCGGHFDNAHYLLNQKVYFPTWMENAANTLNANLKLWLTSILSADDRRRLDDKCLSLLAKSDGVALPKAYLMVKACKLECSPMTARGFAKFPILSPVKSQSEEKRRRRLRRLAFKNATS